MKFFIHLINTLFCLAILSLPMQNVMAESLDNKSCCKTEQSKDCCEKDPLKENQQHQNSCGDCCATAHSCGSCFAFIFKNISIENDEPNGSILQSNNFNYSTPIFTPWEDSIWQPPKII